MSLKTRLLVAFTMLTAIHVCMSAAFHWSAHATIQLHKLRSLADMQVDTVHETEKDLHRQFEWLTFSLVSEKESIDVGEFERLAQELDRSLELLAEMASLEVGTLAEFDQQ